MTSPLQRPRPLALALLLVLLCAGPGSAAPPPDRQVWFSLDVGAGYGAVAGSRDMSLDAVGLSGPVFNAALSLSWPRGSNRIGLRASGGFSPAWGEESNFSIWGDGGSREVQANVVTGHLGVQGERGGLWAAMGAGVMYVATSRFDGMHSQQYVRREGVVPDLSFSLGYNAWISDHVAVRCLAEVGGFFPIMLHVRASAQLGFVVRI